MHTWRVRRNTSDYDRARRNRRYVRSRFVAHDEQERKADARAWAEMPFGERLPDRRGEEFVRRRQHAQRSGVGHAVSGPLQAAVAVVLYKVPSITRPCDFQTASWIVYQSALPAES